MVKNLFPLNQPLSVAMAYICCWACICLFEYVCKSHGAMICKPQKPMSFFQQKDKMYLARGNFSQAPQQFFFTESQRVEIISWYLKALFMNYQFFHCHTGYSFWDRLRNFLHKFTWIVLSVHKLNNLGKFW